MTIKDVLDKLTYRQSIKIVDSNGEQRVEQHLYGGGYYDVINILNYEVKCLTTNKTGTLIIHTVK